MNYQLLPKNVLHTAHTHKQIHSAEEGVMMMMECMEPSMQVLITSLERSCVVDIDPTCSLEVLELTVAQEFGLPACCGAFSLASSLCVIDVCSSDDDESSSSVGSILCCAGRQDGVRELFIKHKIHGGIDFQHREGSKIGSGGLLSESQAAIERKERLRKLALETIDITKDPYFFKNHLGSFECKLCFTLHPNEGNYLAHTQGKRHQSNLGRRAAMEAKSAAPKVMAPKEITPKRVIKIGRPGYKVRLMLLYRCHDMSWANLDSFM
jgi:hypothetical protein